MDSNQWNRVGELFDCLLAGADLTEVLAAEADPALRQALEGLWEHHLRAGAEGFLRDSLQFEVVPTFRTGQILANRFQIERMLGSGGMGEVYLAMDLRIEEQIAIKTMARLLAPSPSLRRRIIAEVQSARRVTHPNVCRIYDLFEEGETVFFSMEYVEGRLLSDWLAAQWVRRQAHQITLQLANGLHAAHKTVVVHGDFKPSNVIVSGDDAPRAVIMDFGLARALDREASGEPGGFSVGAGTAEYMAPELLAGAPPTIRSDIFAFGKVAQQLLPGERLWDECTRSEPRERPASLEPILRRLHPGATRRQLLLGAGITAAAAVTYSVWQSAANTRILPRGARVLVNGFSTATDSPLTRLARSMLLTALRQSPELRAIADQDILPAINRLQNDGHLPLSGNLLGRLVEQLNAKYWVDGSLDQTGSRFSLQLRVFRSSDQRLLGESSFRDRPTVFDVAQQSALWLRTAAGESERSLALNPVTVATYTSSVPEALEKYYDAMERYSVADMDSAIPLLEEAVRLDLNFAQAHNMLGMALFPKFQYERSFREMQIAKSLAAKLPERENAWLLSNYYAVVEDPAQMVYWAMRNKAYYPDDSRCLRTLARVLCRTGDAPKSIEYSREVLDATPESDLARKDLIDNLSQAGNFDEALAEYQVALNRTVRDKRLHRAGAMAYLGLERYPEARDAFMQTPNSRDLTLDLQRVRIMQGEFSEAISALTELRSSANTANEQDPNAPSAIEVHQWNEFLCGTSFLCGRLDVANRAVEEMADLPPYPPMARRLDCAAFWAYRLGNGPVLAKVHDRLAEIRKGWENDFTRTVERHAMALLSWRDKSTTLAEHQFLDASDRAFSPWRLFDAADFFTATGRPQRAMDFWDQWSGHRGMIVEFWFPGALGLEWLSRSATLQALNRRAEAHRYSQKVLDHWSQKWPGTATVLAARNINLATKP